MVSNCLNLSLEANFRLSSFLKYSDDVTYMDDELILLHRLEVLMSQKTYDHS
jgi:hypothetical protein